MGVVFCFFPSLSLLRLLAVIFVFTEDPFGVLLLSIARQPIKFAGLPRREAPPHPRPLHDAEPPPPPVRPLLHLNEALHLEKGDTTTKEGQHEGGVRVKRGRVVGRRSTGQEINSSQIFN